MENKKITQKGGYRKGSGRKPLLVKKRAYFIYFYESEVNALGGWEVVKPLLHKRFNQLRANSEKEV